jgi:hypothetical protein
MHTSNPSRASFLLASSAYASWSLRRDVFTSFSFCARAALVVWTDGQEERKLWPGGLFLISGVAVPERLGSCWRSEVLRVRWLFGFIAVAL